MLWWEGGISFHRNPLNRLFVIQYEEPGWLTALIVSVCLPQVGNIETKPQVETIRLILWKVRLPELTIYFLVLQSPFTSDNKNDITSQFWPGLVKTLLFYLSFCLTLKYPPTLSPPPCMVSHPVERESCHRWNVKYFLSNCVEEPLVLTFPTIKGEGVGWLGPVLEWSFCISLSDLKYCKVFPIEPQQHGSVLVVV